MGKFGLRQTPEGVRLHIRANPGSRHNGVKLGSDGKLRVTVTQVAEKGKANSVIMKVLAETLALATSQLKLVSGANRRDKVFLVSGATLGEIAAHLSANFEFKS